MAKRPAPFKAIAFDGGREVTVEWGCNLGRLAEGYARGGDHMPGKIRLAVGQPRSTLRGSLFHEILHECWSEAELGRFLSQKTEELVIEDLTLWLLDTLRRNPALVDFLMEDA